VGAAAAVAVVGAATPVVLTAWSGGGGSPAPEVVMPPQQTPDVNRPADQIRPRLVVIAYGDPWTESFRLLDRDTGEYVEIPYLPVALSPDGTRMLVQGGLGSPADPYRIGVLDLETTDIRWVNGYTEPGNWSPNGQEFVVSRS